MRVETFSTRLRVGRQWHRRPVNPHMCPHLQKSLTRTTDVPRRRDCRSTYPQSIIRGVVCDNCNLLHISSQSELINYAVWWLLWYQGILIKLINPPCKDPESISLIQLSKQDSLLTWQPLSHKSYCEPTFKLGKGHLSCLVHRF